MIYQTFQPQLALQTYVKEYLLLHFDFNFFSKKPIRTYTPQPEQCLTFNPKGHLTAINKQTGEVQRRNYSYFSAQQISTYDLSLDTDYLMLKIVFQPSAMFQLFKIPLDEFGGLYVDAETIFNKEMRLVNEQLANATKYLNMINIIENYLLQKVKKIKHQIQPIDNIATILNNQPDQFSLQSISSQVYLSPRQFERKFIERIGVRPKLYHRITRFHRAFELKNSNPKLDWLSVAIICGYTDFQHLNKDFKEFSTMTPTVF